MKEIEQARTGTSENGNKLCVVKSHQSDLHVLLNKYTVCCNRSQWKVL